MPQNKTTACSDLNKLSAVELKILRSSLLNWKGDLCQRDKGILELKEVELNIIYQELLKKLNTKIINLHFQQEG